ncbi:hypothetical protein GOP47_0026998 [Adiantum capillus-veneris]|nr:hypothetical protein GOP47_0026998 [Adiantum capillus-veneris]
MDSKPLLDAIDLDDEEQVIHLLKTSNGELCSAMVNSKLSLPGWAGFTLLHWASQRGHVRSVSLLLAAGASVTVTDEAGDTVLHHAACFRRTAVVELLLHVVPLLDLNTRNKDGNTPLHLAAERNAARIVKLLASSSSCRLNDQNHDGDTPLHQAARCGNCLALKLILTYDSTDSTIRNHDGDTALHLAVASGRLPSVEALLICKNAASSLDAKNKARLTPLLVACSSKYAYHMMNRTNTGPKTTPVKEIVELLIQEGADINARDKDGNTALHLAARSGNADALTAILSSSVGVSPAQGDNADASASLPLRDQSLSVRARKKAEILTWVSHAIEAEQMDEISPSPYPKEHFYSREWRLDRVPSSLDARVNLPNKDGETALHLAARHGHRTATEILLDLHADANQLNKYFDSPLDYAFKARHDHIVALLIRRGAELSDRIKHVLVEMAVAEVGKNPLLPKPRGWDLQDSYLLHTTAMAGRTKILEALLEGEGRDVNARNEWKQTPLHCAAILGKTAVVMSLVKKQELRANAEDRRGKTALQYAMECKHSEAEKLLLERMDVKENMDRLYRDRQVYIDAANAILVGAALIGGVTYSGWLQPPLGYVDDGYADISSIGVRVFWVFNSLSFCFSMCTVLAGAGAILPCPEVYIARVVKEVRRALAAAAFLMVLSILCVLAAFTAAGIAVVKKPGKLVGPWLMGASVTPGILIAIALMLWFITKMWALLPQWCMPWLRIIFLRRKLSSSRGLRPTPRYPLTALHDHHHHPSPFSSSSPSPSLSGVYL